MESLPAGPVSQSVSLLSDSFKLLPQHWSGKVWRSEGSAMVSPQAPQGFISKPRRL